MAKKGSRRHRRTAEEMISDLEQELNKLKNRAKTKALQQSPATKAALNLIRHLDKALDLAAEEGDGKLRHALADARKPISVHFDAAGIELPKARIPRGRRPK